MIPQLRDYLYLDLKRLEDYLSILEPTGEVRQLSETIHNERLQASSMSKFDEPANEGDPRHGEVITERTMSVSAKNAFNRLYEKLSGSIIDIDEKPGEVEKGSAVEVTRDFKASPVAQVIESLPESLQMFMSSAELELDEEEKRILLLKLTPLLSAPSKEGDIPIVAKAPRSSYSIVFLAEPQYILRGLAGLVGDMTLVGKAKRVIPDNQELNLLALPNVLPPGIQQSGMQDDDMLELFTDSHEELGFRLDSDAFTIKGPVIVVDALAVYA